MRCHFQPSQLDWEFRCQDLITRRNQLCTMIRCHVPLVDNCLHDDLFTMSEPFPCNTHAYKYIPTLLSINWMGAWRLRIIHERIHVIILQLLLFFNRGLHSSTLLAFFCYHHGSNRTRHPCLGLYRARDWVDHCSCCRPLLSLFT